MYKLFITLSNFSKSISIFPKLAQSIPHPISTPTILGITFSPRFPVNPITQLLPLCTLNKHLAEIDKTANEKVNKLINELAKNNNIPLHYDGKMNQLEWVILMNNYKHCAEEIIYSELIYC